MKSKLAILMSVAVLSVPIAAIAADGKTVTQSVKEAPAMPL